MHIPILLRIKRKEIVYNVDKEVYDMSTFDNDQQYLSKIKKMVNDDPLRLISELHEAHYLLEQDVISENCYEEVKKLIEETNVLGK